MTTLNGIIIISQIKKHQTIMIPPFQIGKLFIITILILSFACTEGNNRDEDPMNEIEVMKNDSLTENDSLYFLALGDSYTIGQGVDISERWPNQLSAKLRENDIKVGRNKIIARTGWTTTDLINAVENSNFSSLGNNRLVSLLIGVNNQYQRLAFETFEIEFNTLLNKSVQIAGDIEKVFVVSIPDYGVTPFGSYDSERIAEELDTYNAYMKNECDIYNIPFIDITEISRILRNSPSALASDRLHPSGFQYEKWVEEILPVVLEMLSE